MNIYKVKFELKSNHTEVFPVKGLHYPNSTMRYTHQHVLIPGMGVRLVRNSSIRSITKAAQLR